MSRDVPYDEAAYCDVCNTKGAYDFMGDQLCECCAAADLDPWPVTCARCGKQGTSATFEVEEGDEWECPECWERCEAARARDSAPCFGCASGLVAVDGKHYMGGDPSVTGIIICECTADPTDPPL